MPTNKLFVENIAAELQKRRSPSIVFVISEDPALDRKELPLVEALRRTVGRGMGTVLSCIPGQLALSKQRMSGSFSNGTTRWRNANMSASSSVAKMRILERNGIYIKKIRTDKPGYVVYEDEWQLVAEPFRKGTMSRK